MGKHSLGWVPFYKDGPKSYSAKKIDKIKTLTGTTQVFVGSFPRPHAEGSRPQYEEVTESARARSDFSSKHVQETL